MKMQRYLLYIASLAVCMLLVLSACGGPTPIAGGVTETVTPASPTTGVPSTEPPGSTGSPTAGVSPSPAATEIEVIPTPGVTPPATPGKTDTPTPPATDTPAPDDAKPGRPTETPVVLNITPPEISGYSLQQEPDGGWVYKDKSGKEVAHTVIYNWKGLSSTEMNPRVAIVVSDKKLMEYLSKKGNEDRDEASMPFPPLPFDPQGLELQDSQDSNGRVAVVIKGRIKEIVQPFPGQAFVLRNDNSLFKKLVISPDNNWSLTIYATDFQSALKPLYGDKRDFLARLAYNFQSGGVLPEKVFGVMNANALITIGSYNPSQRSLTMNNILSIGGYTIAAGRQR